MRVITPLGEYPLEAGWVELRGRELIVGGVVGGLRSGVVVGPRDVLTAARRLAPLIALAIVVLAARRISAG
jgi:hypothetical protein